jgi:EmrB/QacA subfamily drug resistance transporter
VSVAEPLPAGRGPALPTLLGLACGAILVPLNSTMLAVALPSIRQEFGVSPSTVATLVTLYLGAVVVALPVSGTLGDRYGHRRIFLLGVGGFALSSLLAAATSAFVLLAAARVAQAACGALVSVSAVALVRIASSPDRRGSAFGLFDMLVSTSAAVGPFVGGVLVTALGWRWLFLLALPVAAIAAASVGLLLRVETEPISRAPDVGTSRRPPVDVAGLVLLALSLVALLAALHATESVLGRVALLTLPILLVAFAWRELHTPLPAVDLRLFRRRGYSSAVSGVLGITVVLHASFILVPLEVQELLHGSATSSGIVLLGISGLAALAAPFGGRASDLLGRRAPAVAGALVVTAGLLLLWRTTPDATIPALAVMLGLVGLGMGLSGSPRLAAALETVDPETLGMAAATYSTGRYLGGVLGATLAGAVLANGVTAAGTGLGYGILSGIGLAVAIISLGLPGRAAIRQSSGESTLAEIR